MAWLTHVLYLACLTHFPVVIARGIPDPRRRGDMKAEEEVDLVDKMSTQGQKGHPISLLIQEILKTRGTSNIFSYQKIFQGRGTSNISSYPRNIENKRDFQYLFLSKKYFKQEGHPIFLMLTIINIFIIPNNCH